MADLTAKIAEGLTCSICYEYYRNPKVLGCLHRFCRDCLHKYINAKGRDNGVVCPECRQVTRPPPAKSGTVLRLADLADSFPTDFLVKSMVDNLKTQQKNVDCSVHVGNPIVLYCQDCRKMICHVCSGVDHRKCERVIPLRQEAERERARLIKHLNQIQLKKNVLKRNHDELRSAKTDLDRSYDNAASKARREFQKIQKLVKEREDICLKNLRSQHDQEVTHITVAEMLQLGVQTQVDAAECVIRHALKTKSDSQIVKTKTDFTIPDVRPRDFIRSNRPFDSYEECFEGVLKKAKIEETKGFLETK